MICTICPAHCTCAAHFFQFERSIPASQSRPNAVLQPASKSQIKPRCKISDGKIRLAPTDARVFALMSMPDAR